MTEEHDLEPLRPDDLTTKLKQVQKDARLGLDACAVSELQGLPQAALAQLTLLLVYCEHWGEFS